MRIVLFLIASFIARGQAMQHVTISSSASANIGLAPESLATAIGLNLPTETRSANLFPWPTTLGGASVQISDSAMMSRPAGLLFISPTQINFQVPAGTAVGPASVLINTGTGLISMAVKIQAVAPGLFMLNDLGVAGATAIRVTIPTQDQSPVPVFRCVDTAGSCRLVPIPLGVDTPIYLTLYGTGIRGRSSLSNVTVTIGNQKVAPVYAGAQPTVPGLDQINVRLPLALRGTGEISVTVTVDGVISNPVKINVL